MRFSTAACVLAAASLGACDRASPPAADTATSVAIHVAPADTGIGAKHSDWATLEQQLPKDPAAAAAVLERFREANGLPLEFDIPDHAPAARVRGLEIIDDDLAGKSAIVFVRRMPDSTSILGTAPVIEFDSTGRIIRRWNIPRDVEFWLDVVEGAVGDELITAYRSLHANVHLRFRPDGSFRVSADPPPPLEPQKAVGADGLSEPPGPRGIDCPRSKEFEGMICSSFPGEHGGRRLGYPAITT
jgi:hypothetical protein